MRSVRTPWRVPWSAAALAAALALAPRAPDAAGGAYRGSAHGDRDRGALRQRGVPRGACAQCHGRQAGAAGGTALFAPNDNTLCFSCHADAVGTYLGRLRYGRSSHATESGVAWPGPQPPARPPQDAGKCLNCHDPHAAKDEAGIIPSMLRVRGEALCLACHGIGRGAKDIAGAMRLPFRHPAKAPAAPGRAGAASRAEPGEPGPREGCSACHNPHVAAGDSTAPRAPSAPASLAGVFRVRLAYGAPGAEPVATPVPAEDVSPAAEHEVCLACHAVGRAGAGAAGRSASVAAQLNPNNASSHPVLAPARSATLDRAAFTAGWSADRMLYCSDCHSSDGGTRGPHGSTYPHILKKRHPSQPGDRMLPSDLCFDCHAYRTYGDVAGGAAHDLSRFPGHASHVARGDTCAACHESHGSLSLPALLALRTPGMLSYVQDVQGGTCTVTCHRTSPVTGSYRSTARR